MNKKRPFRVMKREADAFVSGLAPRQEPKMHTEKHMEDGTAACHATTTRTVIHHGDTSRQEGHLSDT